MQDILFMFHSVPVLFIFSVGLIALLFGSFLNVVIARLPITLKQSWRKDCYEYLELSAPTPDQEECANKITLLLPRSHCPKCKATLRAIDNIPIISYLFLRGKCHFCHEPISIKYPVVEALTCILCMLVAWKFGVTWQTVAGCVLTCVLIAQSGIDIENKIIPDEITLPILWLGIILSLCPIFVNSQSSILGAVAGYLVLWLIYWCFYLVTKKEGMGFGDFKLLAMLGAWLGWQMLPFLIIFSSAIGSVVGVMFILFSKTDRNTRIPFGPFLAIAGWIALLCGPEINSWYLTYAGIY
jgi:leader peptidase (prepilin peptidase)/N-methyltransferase